MEVGGQRGEAEGGGARGAVFGRRVLVEEKEEEEEKFLIGSDAFEILKRSFHKSILNSDSRRRTTREDFPHLKDSIHLLVNVPGGICAVQRDLKKRPEGRRLCDRYWILFFSDRDTPSHFCQNNRFAMR